MQSQENINSVWRGIWLKQAQPDNIRKAFKSSLFIEAYPVLKKYLPNKDINFLEVGMGTGRYGLAFARDLPNSKFVLSDILEESLALAKELANQLKLSNVEFLTADVFNLPFENDKFDVVFSDTVIQHLKDYREAFKSLVNVVKPGGILILSVVNHWNIHTLLKKMKGKNYEYGFEKSFKISELKKMAQDSGCEVIATNGFAVAYGFSRYRPKFMKILASIVNFIVRILDGVSGRYFSRKFGFEICLVALKK